jgi:hypothetical protein
MPPERDPDDASALARLNSRLYAPGASASQLNESLRPAAPVSAPVAWTPPPAPVPKKRLPASVLFLIAAAGFFVIAGGVAAYLLFFGARVVSSDRVEITVDTAPSISSGDAASVLISVVNRNPVPIRATSLTIDFPDSAREPENLAKEMSHYADTLGTIEPGARVERTVRVALFGTEGESITLPVRLEYQTDGSQTPFVKEESHALTITSSPLSVSVKAPVESGVGQPLTVSVTVRSNARVALDRVALLPSYPPSGFMPAAGTPGTGTLIPIGTLAPGEERTVLVHGSIFGEVTDEHVFRFAAGTRASDDASALAVTYASSLASVALTKPFIATGLTLNQSDRSAHGPSGGAHLRDRYLEEHARRGARGRAGVREDFRRRARSRQRPSRLRLLPFERSDDPLQPRHAPGPGHARARRRRERLLRVLPEGGQRACGREESLDYALGLGGGTARRRDRRAREPRVNGGAHREGGHPDRLHGKGAPHRRRLLEHGPLASRGGHRVHLYDPVVAREHR